MIRSPFIHVDPKKAINLEDLPAEAWTILLGGTSEDEIAEHYRRVPWLYRGVNYLAGKVSGAPFALVRGDEEVTTSDDYEAPTEYLDKLGELLWLASAGLVLRGQHYLFKERNRMRTLKVRNLASSTIEPKFSKTEGLTHFIRRIDNTDERLELEDLLYFWLPDSDVEIGPPNAWPAKAALEAAGVLRNVDKFAASFFARGAIKITLLKVRDIVESERQRIKSWWQRLTGKGIDTAFGEGVVNAETVEPVVVGDGISELTDNALTQEKREDISTALGIPQSILFSNAANFAVSEQDKRNLYEDTLIPLADFIADVFNEQLLKQDKLRLVFRWNTLDIFQEDEEDRSGAFLNYVNAGLPVSVVGPMLGLELPPGMEWETLETFTPEPVPMSPNGSEIPVAAGTVPEPEKSFIEIDLDKWQRKANKALKRGKAAAVSFESEFIPLSLNASIAGALECATSHVAVGNIFEDALRWKNYP